MANYKNNTQQSIKSLLSNINISSGSVIAGQNNLNGNWILSKDVSDYVKRYEILELAEDLLTLSVCWKRLRENGGLLRITKLTDDELFKHTQVEDRSKAGLIRDYYSKKIMMLKIKSQQLTPFRQDLNEFIHGDGKKVKDTMLPMVYRLPEFYDYDVAFDNFASDFNRTVVGYDKAPTQKLTLSFIKKLTINTNRRKRTEYWFNDANNNLVLMTLEINNPLMSLLDNIVTSQNIDLIGSSAKRVRDDREYLNLVRYSFV